MVLLGWVALNVAGMAFKSFSDRSHLVVFRDTWSVFEIMYDVKVEAAKLSSELEAAAGSSPWSMALSSAASCLDAAWVSLSVSDIDGCELALSRASGVLLWASEHFVSGSTDVADRFVGEVLRVLLTLERIRRNHV